VHMKKRVIQWAVVGHFPVFDRAFSRSYYLSKTSVSSYVLIGRLKERRHSPGVLLLLRRSDRRALLLVTGKPTNHHNDY